MEDVHYYLAVFKRRLPYFLIVSTLVSAIFVAVAFTMPPAYESRMVLLVEAPKIPEDLASSTVQTPAFEQLQLLQQRVFTRNNLLTIAREHNALPEMSGMSPDEIVGRMRDRTGIQTSNRFAQEVPLMTVSFEAPVAITTAAVLNAYLDLILQQDSEFRRGRSTETLEFFQQELERLGTEIDRQGARILQFKQDNTDALPESLDFRMDQQSDLQDQLAEIDREINGFRSQRSRLVQLYELTGGVDASTTPVQSAEERALEEAKTELQNALAIYAPDNPRVKLLETRIKNLEAAVDASDDVAEDTREPVLEEDLPPVLRVQLDEVDAGIDALEAQKERIQERIDALTTTIERTPEVAIVLEEMNRKYETIQDQYERAEERLSAAQIGDQIETRSRGQRITVIEQPTVPDRPTKPSRKKMAVAGTGLGMLAGIALIVLLEFFSNTARRPEDIIKRFGVTPISTIPYIQTKGQRIRRRARQILVLLLILGGIPAALYAIHIYYLPLDLIAEKVMDKLGIRL